MLMTDFVIENGVLVKYSGTGGDVIIPDSVSEIGFRLAMIFAVATFFISVYGRAHAKRLLKKQTAAETAVTETTEAEGESS